MNQALVAGFERWKAVTHLLSNQSLNDGACTIQCAFRSYLARVKSLVVVDAALDLCLFSDRPPHFYLLLLMWLLFLLVGGIRASAHLVPAPSFPFFGFAAKGVAAQ